MDTLGFRELRDFVEKAEMLEISLQDISKQLKNNIDETKNIQKNGIEIERAQIKQIIKEVQSDSNGTASLLKYLIFANIGFLFGLIFAMIFLV